MRADITVVDQLGEARDFRIEGPDGLTWSDVPSGLLPIDPGMPAEPLSDGVRIASTKLRPLGPALVVVGGPNAGTRFPLDPGVITVGRASSCSIRLADPAVSRAHLTMTVAARVCVEACTPASRLFVNEAELHGPHVLRPGDRLRIGDTVVALDEPAPPPVPPKSARIEFPVEPSEASASGRWLAGLAIPVIASLGTAVVAGSREFLLIALIAPALILVVVAVGAAHSRRGRRQRTDEVRERIEQAEAELAAACGFETETLWEAWPGPRITSDPSSARETSVRVGLGRMRASTQVVRGGENSHPILERVPILLEFGPAGLALTAPAELARGQARWILCQLAAALPAARLRISLLSDGLVEAKWRWLRWLPQFSLDCTMDSLRSWQASGGERIGLLVVDGAGFEDPTGISVLRIGGINPRCSLDPLDDTGTLQLLAQTGRAPVELVADTISVEFADAWARGVACRSSPAEQVHVHLLDLLSLSPSVSEIAARWQHSGTRVRAPIGISADGHVAVDLDRDGPHALIAGTTGAGKSELLRALVLAIASLHPPAAVQFLLIDYKGGAAFGRCTALPHTAGVMTDLDGSSTARAIRSLTAELHRRERLLAESGAANIQQYLADGRGADLARLIVIVDEFAGLAGDLPQFIAGLVGIAQRGRALGMHLVLATQRPAGCVSPDIRANANLRIALRTISAADSIDVIDCADAASLAAERPGQAIRAGSPPTVFQAASIGGSRVPTETRVTALDAWRMPVADQPCTHMRDHEQDLLDAIVEAAQSATAPPPPPWLPPLPETISSTSLGTGGRVPVAIVDLPDEQRRDVLDLDLDVGGVLVVAGARRSGRTGVLACLAFGAASRRSPDDVHIHAIDFGGGDLTAVRGLPHLGTFTTTTDPVSLTSNLIAHLANRDVGPPILLLIDDYGALCAALDAYDLGISSERLRTLLARAKGSAATVILTGDRAVLAPQLAAVSDERIVLRCGDPAAYQLAGIAAKDVPAHLPPGRGIRASDGAELQCLHIDSQAQITGQPATGTLRLRPLPTGGPRRIRPNEPGRLCLGIAGDRAQPAWLDRARTFRLLVAGPPQSGKSSLLLSVLADLDPAELVVAAPPSSPLLAAADALAIPLLGSASRPGALLLIDDVEHLADMTADLELPDRVIAAGASDRLLSSFRGLPAEVKRWQCGIVLRPSALDGELLGVRLARTELGGPPGRGVAVGRPEWAWPTSIATPGRTAIQTWLP